MAFIPRKTTPSISDLHWKIKSVGGYNKCVLGNSTESVLYSSVLPNCTGYAYGRFMEILGSSSCKLSLKNACTWYLNISDGYERGTVPRVGAVICWSQLKGAGHVAIIEEVRSDGSILTSESGWFSGWANRFRTVERTNLDGRWGAAPDYIFQGFIYNPNCSEYATPKDTATSFVSEASSHIGEKASWTWKKIGLSNIEWAAAFISAVAMETDIAGKCIYKSCSCSSLASESVKYKYGTFHKGPGQGGQYRPCKGDIIFFRTSTSVQQNEYSCDHSGIVIKVTSSVVFTVEGNTGGNDKATSIVSAKSYSISATQISGYFHPDWSLVGSSDPANSYYTGYLYNTATTRKDMMMREIGYLDANYKPSIQSSTIKLSVINYTGLLSKLFEVIAPESMIQNSSIVNTDKLQGNCRIVVDYLLDKGLNAAAACGIAGNIYHISRFATGTDSNTKECGICRWSGVRGVAMQKMAGSDWSTNLTGQLNYLWYELNTLYKTATLVPIQGVTNDAAGCKNATEIFIRTFECLKDTSSLINQRQESALAYFNEVVVVSRQSSNVEATLKTFNGIDAKIVKTVEVPPTVIQSGIVRNYTNYTYFFSRWSNTSLQRRLADIWDSKGRTHNRNIATLDGYYLVAMSAKFATTGDIVSIELENGDVIHAILGDAKGADATSPWGHVLGSGGVDIIEWEAIGNGQAEPTKIDLGTWSGKKVVRVHNRGTYLR